MVSRRTFAAITMLMAIILFLFQGLNLAKEKLNHYEKNAYAAEKEDLEYGSGAFGTEDASGEKNRKPGNDRLYRRSRGAFCGGGCL